MERDNPGSCLTKLMVFYHKKLPGTLICKKIPRKAQPNALPEGYFLRGQYPLSTLFVVPHSVAEHSTRELRVNHQLCWVSEKVAQTEKNNKDDRETWKLWFRENIAWHAFFITFQLAPFVWVAPGSAPGAQKYLRRHQYCPRMHHRHTRKSFMLAFIAQNASKASVFGSFVKTTLGRDYRFFCTHPYHRWWCT